MAYLKGVDLSGSSDISGSKAIFDQITGSFIKGDGSGITGVISASYAVSASHEIIKEISSSHADVADTASYVAAANIDGTVVSSSYAITASHATNVPETASYALQSLSSSYALTASHALNVPVTASYALTASYVETAQSASYVALAQTASYVTLAQTASYVTTAQTSSYVAGANVDGTVQNAVSASYAPGTGVTSIIAGSGITIDQSTGAVTISTDSIVGGSIATGSFSGVTSTSLTHNFGSTNIIVAVYDGSGNEIIPATTTLDSANKVTATFASPQSGTIVVIEAQTGEFATGSFSNTGSFTLNHSLGTQDLNVVAYDSNDAQFYPDIDILDSSNVKATFAASSSGTLLAIVRAGTVSSSFSNTVDTTITHNLSSSAVIASVYDASYNKIIPSSVSIVDTSSINLTFASTSSGNVVIVGGPIDSTTISTATSFTGAITGSSSYTVNHYLNTEWPLVQVYESASRAQYVPQSVVSVDANSVQLTFSTTFDGYVTINS